MKKISLHLGIFMMLSAILLGACTNSASNEVVEKDDTREVSVVFTFALPKGEPVLVRSIHDAPEYTLNSLWMYEFSADGNQLISLTNIKGDLIPGTPSEGYKYEKKLITTDGKATRRFVFIANDNIGNVASISALNDKLATLQLNGTTGAVEEGKKLLTDDKYIPMTGTAKQGNSQLIAITGSSGPISVQLTRIVARIDVKNAVPNLIIEGLHLINTNDRSYILPATENGELTYAAPTAAQKVMLGTFAQLPAPFDFGEIGNYRELKKAFYLYEGPQPAEESNALHIVVAGKLGGQPVVYEIPFMQNDQMITVKRNHLYRLQLGNGEPVEEGTDITFTIEDTPWNEVIVNEKYQIINPTYYGTVNGTKWDKLTHKLLIDSRMFSLSDDPGLGWTLKTEFKDHTTFQVEKVPADATWLSFEMNTTKPGETLLKVGAKSLDNGPDKRSAQLIIKSDADPSAKVVLTIVQAR